jgi:hypothetical protein
MGFTPRAPELKEGSQFSRTNGHGGNGHRNGFWSMVA